MTEATEVAKAIFYQFGGARALAMIGGKCVVFNEGIKVAFNCGRDGIAVCVIMYRCGSDDYSMVFRMRSGRQVGDEVEGAFGEDLRRIFEMKTGLYLSL